MAAPANPTLDSIVTEGLKQGGELSPSTDLLNRAKNEWIEQIKNDLWNDLQQPKYLQVTSYGIMVKGQSRYSCPADFSSDLALTLLDGDISGVAAGGSQTTLVLPSSFAGLAEGDLLGLQILITSGQGVASCSECIGWDPVTLTLRVAPAFASAPGLGATFLVVGREREVTQKHMLDYQQWRKLGLGRPEVFFPQGDEDYGEFLFECPLDKAYGARLRYYSNIMKLDLDSTLMTTLYQQWRNFWILGIKAKCLCDNDDSRGPDARAEYKAKLSELRMKQTYGNDLHSLVQRVSDYA